MALRKPSFLKLPKKPKRSASNTVKENYLRRVKEVESENAKRKKDYEAAVKKRKELDAKIYR